MTFAKIVSSAETDLSPVFSTEFICCCLFVCFSHEFIYSSSSSRYIHRTQQMTKIIWKKRKIPGSHVMKKRTKNRSANVRGIQFSKKKARKKSRKKILCWNANKNGNGNLQHSNDWQQTATTAVAAKTKQKIMSESPNKITVYREKKTDELHTKNSGSCKRRRDRHASSTLYQLNVTENAYRSQNLLKLVHFIWNKRFSTHNEVTGECTNSYTTVTTVRTKMKRKNKKMQMEKSEHVKASAWQKDILDFYFIVLSCHCFVFSFH